MADTHLVTFQVTYRIPMDAADVVNYDPGLHRCLPRDAVAAMVIDDFERNEAEFLLEVAGYPESYSVTHVEEISG